ncbi:hypothetical protein VNO78_13747 [Psophocarpus tetragonolobus]|uniref:Uncharacterized protein n=1 Tax=Psophocarpus tetragonolobus TaxID=3891 RepID=A0AAN9SQP1_PSOTE
MREFFQSSCLPRQQRDNNDEHDAPFLLLKFLLTFSSTEILRFFFSLIHIGKRETKGSSYPIHLNPNHNQAVVSCNYLTLKL